MLIFRHANLVLVKSDAFVSTDSRMYNIGIAPGITRAKNMCNESVFDYKVDLIQLECVVSTVVGCRTCVKPSLHVSLYVVTTIVVDVLNGMESTKVTSIAGTETNVLVIIIDAEVNVSR